MPVEFSGCGPPLVEADIAALEEELKIKLPDEYRRFLLKYNGGYPDPSGFGYRSGPYGANVMSEFVSIGTGPFNLRSEFVERKINDKQMADDLMSIGYDGSGDLVCIGLEGNRWGKVYLWNHEEDNTQGEPGCEIYFVASSFDEFLKRLTISKELPINPAPLWANKRPQPPEPVVQLTLWDDETTEEA